MSVITRLKNVKDCFNTLTNIYENKDPIQKRGLKNKILDMEMEKDEIVSLFFTNISEVRYKLMSTGLIVDDDNLIPLQQKLDLASNLAPDFSVIFSQLW